MQLRNYIKNDLATPSFKFLARFLWAWILLLTKIYGQGSAIVLLFPTVRRYLCVLKMDRDSAAAIRKIKNQLDEKSVRSVLNACGISEAKKSWEELTLPHKDKLRLSAAKTIFQWQSNGVPPLEYDRLHWQSACDFLIRNFHLKKKMTAATWLPTPNNTTQEVYIKIHHTFN